MLLGLDHVNLRTSDVEAMRAFYVDVVGLRAGPRPAFSFGGAWLYCDDRAVVHLVEVEPAARPKADLSLEHFSLRARGLADFLARIESCGVPMRLGFVRDIGVCQVNLNDPDGTRLHVDFDIAEAIALGLAEPGQSPEKR